MILAFLALCAHASEGFYSPADLAAESALYAKAGEATAGEFEAHNAHVEALAKALADYELALDLLGARAPEAERARLDALTTEYNREFAVLQDFAGHMVDDFDGAFLGALDRARAKYPEAVECERDIADGPGVPGMKRRTKPNPACKGTDLNGTLAKAMDADPKLVADVADIAGRTWPNVELDTTPQPAIPTGDRSVDVVTLFKTGAKGTLKAIADADSDARLDFEAAIEQGASEAELQKFVGKAAAITAATAAKRAALAAPVFAASEKAFAKWVKKGEAPIGWCANPPLLGGCTATDATGELSERILALPKVAKSLQAR